MIHTWEAVRTARNLLGTPYEDLDCINLVKAVIRRSPGGKKNYTTAGTNTLWKSMDSSPKYQDLVWRQRGIAGAKAGMLAFKIRKRPDGTEDVYHVGLITGKGRVIHSSGPGGQYRRVVETSLKGWNALGRHRYVEVDGDREIEDCPALYRAQVVTEKDPLRIRSAPRNGQVLGAVPRGKVVDVLEAGSWPFIRFGKLVGYVSGEFLRKLESKAIMAETDMAEENAAEADRGEAEKRDRGRF